MVFLFRSNILSFVAGTYMDLLNFSLVPRPRSPPTCVENCQTISLIIEVLLVLTRVSIVHELATVAANSSAVGYTVVGLVKPFHIGYHKCQATDPTEMMFLFCSCCGQVILTPTNMMRRHEGVCWFSFVAPAASSSQSLGV